MSTAALSLVSKPTTEPEILRARADALEQIVKDLRAQAERMESGMLADGSATVAQAAQEMGVSRTTVRLKVRLGELEAEWHSPTHYTIPRRSIAAYRERVRRRGGIR